MINDNKALEMGIESGMQDAWDDYFDDVTIAEAIAGTGFNKSDSVAFRTGFAIGIINVRGAHGIGGKYGRLAKGLGIAIGHDGSRWDESLRAMVWD